MHTESVRFPLWLAWGLALFMLLGAPAPAAAASPIDPEGPVLILGVRIGSESNDLLRNQLVDWLRRRGLPVVPAPQASPEFDSCAKPACLRALALRAGAGRVLTAHVNESNHVTIVWLFEVGSGVQHQVLEEWGKSSLWASLTGTTERLLRLRPEPKGLGRGLAARLAGLSPFRLALSAGLSGVGLLGLSIAIGAASRHGEPGPGVCASAGEERRCFMDTKALSGTAFALSALSLTGAALTLALPTRRHSASKERSP